MTQKIVRRMTMAIRSLNVVFCIPCFVLFAVCLTEASWAADDDEVFQSTSRTLTGSEKTLRRVYLGARDEGRLELQASLPLPTRNADGSSVILDESGEPVETPASD